MRRVLVVSDTHLSSTGWDNPALATLRRASDENADLVVNTGDITANGADDLRDLTYAKEAHARFTAPVVFVPGNHDVGEEPEVLAVGQPIDAKRLARYRGVFGPDRWARDMGPWRLIGLNSLLIGSNLPDEGAQGEWVMSEFTQARGRPIGIFLHKPLWLEHPGDEPSPMWTIAPERRAAIREGFARAGVRFVVSGHLHQYRAREFDGALHVWAPSAAFPMRDHDFGGERKVGFATLDLSDDGAVSAQFIRT